jgi:AcrR family transcriptional regulator
MTDVALPRIPERRRRPVGQEKRAAILAAIEGLLRERSLSEISISDIAAAAGVGRSGFYFYFASKGAAVTAMLGDVFDKMLAGAGVFVSGPDLRTSSVRTAMHAAWNAWREHQGLILAVLDARGTDAAVRELWDAWIDRFVREIGQAVATRRRACFPDDGVEVADLVRILLSANERSFERLSRAGAGSEQAARTVEALVAVWSRSIHGTYEREIDDA